MRLKMHDLQMTDKLTKNIGVWKTTDWKMTDFIEFPITLNSLQRSRNCNVCLISRCQAQVIIQLV